MQASDRHSPTFAALASAPSSWHASAPPAWPPSQRATFDDTAATATLANAVEALAEAFEQEIRHRQLTSLCGDKVTGLVAALVNAAERCGVLAHAEAEGMVQALIGRLRTPMRIAADKHENGLAGPTSHTRKHDTKPLIAWRLKRTVEYIETHLEAPLLLQDLASTAGLSPMYFAAQFRAATGLRPHEYVLRRRIAAAQTLLSDKRNRPLDVAMLTGFQSQAHFTMVFKRLTGTTPARWKATAIVDAMPA
ncbi:AraC family transcriptional regulator [Robbsia sp. KACC 23696]|uniref:AraC family transcriptional regulator n=1 Tax=Robbsia sp. KACC 23696 TaxID=3149231 RepID=UPI00325B4C42